MGTGNFCDMRTKKPQQEQKIYQLMKKVIETEKTVIHENIIVNQRFSN